jgi:hypothetical protein
MIDSLEVRMEEAALRTAFIGSVEAFCCRFMFICELIFDMTLTDVNHISRFSGNNYSK